MAKRSELKVGQEWAYGRQRSHYIGEHYSKVIIEEVEPHKQYRYGEIQKTTKGLGVKVKLQVGWGTEWRSRVIQLSQLWIPWAEYEVQKKAYTAQREIDEKKAQVLRAKRQEFQEKEYRPALKEFQKVIEAITGKYVSDYTRIEELPIEVIKAITEAIKEKAVA